MRRAIRVSSAIVGALGVYLLYLGGSGAWTGAQMFPWPGRSSPGFSALAGAFAGGIMLLSGLLVAGLGGALAVAGWWMAGLPRPWRRLRNDAPDGHGHL
jgi:hypothetical protein